MLRVTLPFFWGVFFSSLDQIVFSCRELSEIYVIDHSTTTAEAAGTTGGRSGRGGEILYRWGNPAMYGRGTAQQQQFGGQHDVHSHDSSYWPMTHQTDP